MEYFIIWEVHGSNLRIVGFDGVGLFHTFESAELTKKKLEEQNPESKFFIRVFREPEIINALNK